MVSEIFKLHHEQDFKCIYTVNIIYMFIITASTRLSMFTMLNRGKNGSVASRLFKGDAVG